MADEERRLRDAADALAEAANRIEDVIRRLVGKVEAEVIHASRGWKGPAADSFLRGTYERAARLRRARDRMRSLAERMRREAWVVHQEQQRRRQAPQR